MTASSNVHTGSHTGKLKGLYAITDEKLIDEKNFIQTVDLALQGGASIIQYRDKSDHPQKRYQQASALRSLCKQYQATFIINDDIELAKAVSADGVHLGKDDSSIIRARKTLGTNAIIGISCYNDLTLAIEAEENTADYVAFGAVFSSSTKPGASIAGPDMISKARQKISIPICSIGGITDKNIQQLINNGADMTAVISSLFAANDVKKTAETLSQHFR